MAEPVEYCVPFLLHISHYLLKAMCLWQPVDKSASL